MIGISKKSYLSRQIRLLSLTTTDLFTDKEYELYQELVSVINELNNFNKTKDKTTDPTIKENLIQKKSKVKQELDALILAHKGRPRVIQYQRLLDYKSKDKGLKGLTWEDTKLSRRIS